MRVCVMAAFTLTARASSRLLAPVRALHLRRWASGAAHPQRDLYGVLGLNSGAAAGDIKRAYYELSKRHHPDVDGGSPEAFAAISEAYAVLGNRDARRRYDVARARGRPFDLSGAGDGGGAGVWEPPQNRARDESDLESRGFSFNFDEHYEAHYAANARRRREREHSRAERDTRMRIEKDNTRSRVAWTTLAILLVGFGVAEAVVLSRRRRADSKNAIV